MVPLVYQLVFVAGIYVQQLTVEAIFVFDIGSDIKTLVKCEPSDLFWIRQWLCPVLMLDWHTWCTSRSAHARQKPFKQTTEQH